MNTEKELASSRWSMIAMSGQLEEESCLTTCLPGTRSDVLERWGAAGLEDWGRREVYIREQLRRPFGW
jgi:hypothetical protein